VWFISIISGAATSCLANAIESFEIPWLNALLLRAWFGTRRCTATFSSGMVRCLCAIVFCCWHYVGPGLHLGSWARACPEPGSTATRFSLGNQNGCIHLTSKLVHGTLLKQNTRKGLFQHVHWQTTWYAHICLETQPQILMLINNNKEKKMHFQLPDTKLRLTNWMSSKWTIPSPTPPPPRKEKKKSAGRRRQK